MLTAIRFDENATLTVKMIGKKNNTGIGTKTFVLHKKFDSESIEFDVRIIKFIFLLVCNSKYLLVNS